MPGKRMALIAAGTALGQLLVWAFSGRLTTTVAIVVVVTPFVAVVILDWMLSMRAAPRVHRHMNRPARLSRPEEER